MRPHMLQPHLSLYSRLTGPLVEQARCTPAIGPLQWLLPLSHMLHPDSAVVISLASFEHLPKSLVLNENSVWNCFPPLHPTPPIPLSLLSCFHSVYSFWHIHYYALIVSLFLAHLPSRGCKFHEGRNFTIVFTVDSQAHKQCLTQSKYSINNFCNDWMNEWTWFTYIFTLLLGEVFLWYACVKRQDQPSMITHLNSAIRCGQSQQEIVLTDTSFCRKWRTYCLLQWRAGS